MEKYNLCKENLQRAKILIVDDDPVAAAEIFERLFGLGYELLPCLAGADQTLRYASLDAPDLILLGGQ